MDSIIIVRCYDRLPPLRQVGKLSYVGTETLTRFTIGVRNPPCSTYGKKKKNVILVTNRKEPSHLGMAENENTVQRNKGSWARKK